MASNAIDAGLVLLGFLLALYATHVFAKAGRNWEGMRSDITKLALQVEAYYALSKAFSERVARVDPEARAAIKVLTAMRDSIAEDTDNVRPEMTANEAKKIRDRWCQ